MKEIRVNRAAVEENSLGEHILPVFSVLDGGQVDQGNQLVILGACVLKYDPNHSPRIWIETTAPIIWGDRFDPEEVRAAQAVYDKNNLCVPC